MAMEFVRVCVRRLRACSLCVSGCLSLECVCLTLVRVRV